MVACGRVVKGRGTDAVGYILEPKEVRYERATDYLFYSRVRLVLHEYSNEYNRTELRNTKHENLVFRVYRYKHDDSKSKHETNTKN